MDFYYPNSINDMWRIFGHIFFGDRDYFWDATKKRFCKSEIIDFLEKKGIALYDTATRVERLRDNASDNFLKILERTDIGAILDKLPDCCALACTGAKATETAAEIIGCKAPMQGEFVETEFNGRRIKFYRMPSSSRAYPLKLEKKAKAYAQMFSQLGLL